MKIATSWSCRTGARAVVDEAVDRLGTELGADPDFLLVHPTCNHALPELLAHLEERVPGVPFHGGTTCLGVMTETGFHSEEAYGLGLLGVVDPGGGYGAALAVAGESGPEEATLEALDRALAQAGRPGELPAAVLVSDYPGHEERVIKAIEGHLGSRVPIVGGTSADNDMSGQWQQIAGHDVASRGVSVAVLFPSGDVGYSFHSGYEPTEHRGRVTRASERTLHEIDGRPAAHVYDEWTGGLAAPVLQGGSLVPAATLSPLGRPVRSVGGVPFFRLSYPVEVLPDGALLVFTDVHEGDEVVLMTGTGDSLVSRAGRVAAMAVEAAPFRPEETHGAFVLFCAGCMLAVKDRMPEVVDGLRRELGPVPFLGAFTLGEQGCFIGGENRHGNLMVAVLAFGPQRLD
jgi:hypothetical protein